MPHKRGSGKGKRAATPTAPKPVVVILAETPAQKPVVLTLAQQKAQEAAQEAAEINAAHEAEAREIAAIKASIDTVLKDNEAAPNIVKPLFEFFKGLLNESPYSYDTIIAGERHALLTLIERDVPPEHLKILLSGTRDDGNPILGAALGETVTWHGFSHSSLLPEHGEGDSPLSKAAAKSQEGTVAVLLDAMGTSSWFQKTKEHARQVAIEMKPHHSIRTIALIQATFPPGKFGPEIQNSLSKRDKIYLRKLTDDFKEAVAKGSTYFQAYENFPTQKPTMDLVRGTSTGTAVSAVPSTKPDIHDLLAPHSSLTARGAPSAVSAIRAPTSSIFPPGMEAWISARRTGSNGRA